MCKKTARNRSCCNCVGFVWRYQSSLGCIECDSHHYAHNDLGRFIGEKCGPLCVLVLAKSSRGLAGLCKQARATRADAFQADASARQLFLARRQGCCSRCDASFVLQTNTHTHTQCSLQRSPTARTVPRTARKPTLTAEGARAPSAPLARRAPRTQIACPQTACRANVHVGVSACVCAFACVCVFVTCAVWRVCRVCVSDCVSVYLCLAPEGWFFLSRAALPAIAQALMPRMSFLVNSACVRFTFVCCFLSLSLFVLECEQLTIRVLWLSSSLSEFSLSFSFTHALSLSLLPSTRQHILTHTLVHTSNTRCRLTAC